MEEFGWQNMYSNILPTNMIKSPYLTQYGAGGVAAKAEYGPQGPAPPGYAG